MNEVVKLPEAAALGISVRAGIAEGELVFQTHVAQDTPRAELDKLTDTLLAVVERQRAKGTLLELKRNKETQVAQLMNLREDRARIDEQMATPVERRRSARPNETEQRAREQSVVMEGKLVDIIKRFDDQIAEAEAIIAGK